MPTREQIQDVLREVIDPELRKDIVTLGMVRSIEQPEEGRADVIVSLTTSGCPIRAHFEKAVIEKVSSLGISQVNVGFDVLSDQEKQSLSQRPEPSCDNRPHAHERSDPRGAEGRHRPRAPPLDRRARDGSFH